jgi:RimJ/RimL family protein N-acetyltransferase
VLRLSQSTPTRLVNSATEGYRVTTNIKIRRLQPADAARYREIRLAGLRSSPEAFGSTYETESAQPLSSFSERLSSSAVFGAFRGEELLGIAGFFARKGVKEAHKGLLWGMYVRPEARKAGVGRRLVEAVIDFARQHVELLQLSLVKENEQARRLYARLGFVEYGVEKNSLKQEGRYYDEILMALDLVRSSDQDAVRVPRADASLRADHSTPNIALASSNAK